MGSPGLINRNNGHHQQQRLGITEPISLGGPTDYDVTKTRELEKVWSLLSFVYVNCEIINSCPVSSEYVSAALVFARCGVV